MQNYRLLEKNELAIPCQTEWGWGTDPVYRDVVRIEMNNRDSSYYIVCEDFEYENTQFGFVTVKTIEGNSMVLNTMWISKMERLRLVKITYKVTEETTGELIYLVQEGDEVELLTPPWLRG